MSTASSNSSYPIYRKTAYVEVPDEAKSSSCSSKKLKLSITVITLVCIMICTCVIVYVAHYNWYDSSNAALSTSAYSVSQATLQVGAQSWNESGWYADGGYKSGYNGYFCLCQCNASDEGIFCYGGGVHTDKSVVANFLGVFAQDGEAGTWTGDLVAYQSSNSSEYESGKTPPFHDHFKLNQLGGPSNYTGNSQAAEGESFVWRGYMSGVECQSAAYCNTFCDGYDQYETWANGCRSQQEL